MAVFTSGGAGIPSATCEANCCYYSTVALSLSAMSPVRLIIVITVAMNDKLIIIIIVF